MNSENNIPYGYCHCGCGQKTKISPKACTSKGWVKGEPMEYLHGHHIRHGEKHPNWRGGKIIVQNNNNKYVRVSKHGYDRTVNNRVFEHILKAESVLGKSLPAGTVVHHVDGDGLNNDNNNLVICENDSYHKLLHKRQRALDACGDPNLIRCSFCKTYDAEYNLYMFKEGRGYHRECANKYRRDQRRAQNGTM